MLDIVLSIIVPSFNKANFISETIKSVQNQKYRNWELLIVDDGSTDDSIAIIEEFCSIDDRIKLHRREILPKGGSACRNIGLNIAKGEYIIFLDADDVLADFCLEKRLSEIEKFSQNNFWVFPIGTFYKNIGDSTSVWIPKGADFLKRFLKHDLPWHTMSVVWEKKFISELNGFDTDYPRLQDVELHSRALLKNNISLKVFSNSPVDAYYRIDAQRTVQNIEQQLNRQKDGVLLYLQKIGPLLKFKKQHKFIKCTLFSFVTMLNYNCLIMSKEPSLHAKKVIEILDFISKSKIFSKLDILFIRFYINLYKLGLWKIKGFNYTMKNIFKII